MTVSAAPFDEKSTFFWSLVLAGFSGGALALAIAGLAWRLLPAGHGSAAVILGVFALIAMLAYAATADAAQCRFATRAGFAAAFALATAAVSGLSGDSLEPVLGFASLGLAGFLGLRLVRLRRARLPEVLLALAVIAALIAYNAWYVIASRDLEIADFMYYRLVSVAVAALIDQGRAPQLFIELATSMKADYSWFAALLPGIALAFSAPLSRSMYQFALMVFYAAPALFALGWLAREIYARSGVLAARRRVAPLAFAIAAVAAAYPTGLAVTARGMPDIGGLALYVLALALADRLIRALSHPRIAIHAEKLALALAVTLFAMFMFRRWYAFAAAGIFVMLGLEIFALTIWQGRAFAGRSAVCAAALAALVLLALVSPVLVDWLPNPAAHDYSSIYAAYRKPLDVFSGLIGDWWGFAILALSAVAAMSLLLRAPENRLLRLTLGTAVIAAILFLRVQTPYVHHVFLIAPAVTASLAAALLLTPPAVRALGLAALVAATLTPLGALAPKGFFPTYGQPHRPREDLAELARMKDWIDAHATPESKVCGLGSSYTFSGQLLDELWQLKADRSPLHLKPSERVSVPMSDVDTVEGAPAAGLKNCALILVGDPVQTHLIPSYQQTVIVPSLEMLSGVGIGAHFRRSSEVFHLEKGVDADVFERVSPLTDEDMAELTKRWRAARGEK